MRICHLRVRVLTHQHRKHLFFAHPDCPPLTRYEHQTHRVARNGRTNPLKPTPIFVPEDDPIVPEDPLMYLSPLNKGRENQYMDLQMLSSDQVKPLCLHFQSCAPRPKSPEFGIEFQQSWIGHHLNFEGVRGRP